MKKIDRYVAGKFFKFLFLATLAAVTIFLVVDPIENLDKFLDKDVPKTEILRYYLLFIPYILYLVYPVAMLLATMFCIGGLTNSNEMMAMTASGIPLYRHLLNLGIFGLLLSVFMFWWGEHLVPELNRERMSIWREQVRQRVDWRLTEQGQVYVQDGRTRILHIDVYQPRTLTGHGIDLFTFDGPRITERVTARQMSWSGSKWVFHDAMFRTFHENGEDVVERERWESDISIIPDDLVELKLEPEEMSLEELERFVERLRSTGGEVHRWIVDIHGKFARPFAGFIIILFGVPISAVKRRSGVIIGVTISMLIAFLYFGLQQTGQVLGYKEILEPWLAAWIGNIVFLFLGIFLMFRVSK